MAEAEQAVVNARNRLQHANDKLGNIKGLRRV